MGGLTKLTVYTGDQLLVFERPEQRMLPIDRAQDDDQEQNGE